ncbi:hypothetical protein Q1695_001997 [Nippostrongylus brasiliensis]|nr:hypothetical protein Q1695_001997 [Nippostrongylus brasiliensis]
MMAYSGPITFRAGLLSRKSPTTADLPRPICSSHHKEENTRPAVFVPASSTRERFFPLSDYDKKFWLAVSFAVLD